MAYDLMVMIEMWRRSLRSASNAHHTDTQLTLSTSLHTTKNRPAQQSYRRRHPALALPPTITKPHIMPPRAGDAFPNVDLWVLSPATPDNKPRQPVAVKPLDLFKGKRRVVVVGIPGAVRGGGS